MDSEPLVARARLAAIVDSSHDAILAKDLSGIVTAWNPAAQRLYGYTPTEIVGHSISTLVPLDHTGEVEYILAEVREGRTVPPYDTERLHKDGTRVRVSVAVSPIHDAGGMVIGASTIARDITDRLAAEASQAREAALVRELEQARRLESVGQLAGGIAHDFNNLLGVIINLAALVADELPEGTTARADLDEIATAGRRAAALTRQLLIFSRRDVVSAEVFDLGGLVAGLEGFLRRALGEAVALEVDAGDDLWPVEMDRGQAEQIVVNLAVNARDAMPAGGRLVLETRNTTVDEEFARTRAGLVPGEYVTLTVSDTGEGMPPEVVERAFEPFFTTKPEGEGTGLGLATVYGIVAKAGGRVALYSEPGRGTSVNVHLPASHATPTEDDHAAPALIAGHGERILVVEDAADVLRITERILRGADYDVTPAGGAAEAIEIVGREPAFDLVLTDVIMPGMTGTELAMRLRAVRPDQRILFMSGYSGKLLTPELLAGRGSAFIEKPFTADQLRSSVRALLGRSVA